LSRVIVGRDVQGDHAQIDFDHAVNDGDDEKDAWPLGSLQASETKDDASLVFLHDLDGRSQDHDPKDQDNPHPREQPFHNVRHLTPS